MRHAGWIAAFLLSAISAATPAAAEPVHAIAMHGEPALDAGYTHFPYANPKAPKGGTITYPIFGTYNSLNPFIVQGDAVRGCPKCKGRRQAGC